MNAGNLFNQKSLVRSISGLIYVAIILVVLLVKTPWALFGFLAFAAVMGTVELNRLTRHLIKDPLLIAFDCVAAVWFIYALLTWWTGINSFWVFVPNMAYLLYIFGRSAFFETDKCFEQISNTLFGQLYIAVPLALSYFVVYPSDRALEFNGELLLLLFILTWSNDTGAYIVGMLFGKHKLTNTVSPNKSAEGVVGGIAFSIAAALLSHGFIEKVADMYSLIEIAGLGVVVALAAVTGDLLESALKRRAGVKDSGKLLPGHGGVLDRIDSLLFVIPTSLVYFVIINI